MKRKTKMVEGLMIDPTTKTIEVVKYNGNESNCIQTLLKSRNTDYRMISSNDKKYKDKICLFIQNNQEDLIMEKPFSFGESVFFGKGVIVKLGNYNGDYDFNTQNLPKELVEDFKETINFNLKVNYKEKIVYEIESIEEVDEVEVEVVN